MTRKYSADTRRRTERRRVDVCEFLLVLTFLKDPEREYDASEVAEGAGLSEKAVLSHLRSLWKGGILERRKDNDRGRLVYRTKQAQLQLGEVPVLPKGFGDLPQPSSILKCWGEAFEALAKK